MRKNSTVLLVALLASATAHRSPALDSPSAGTRPGSLVAKINQVTVLELIADRPVTRYRLLVNGKPDAVLGLATGATPIAMYKRLIEDCEQGKLSFRHVTTFNLDEYIGIDPDNSQSYRAYMQRELFDHVDVNPANTHLPACAPDESPLEVGPRYEERIVEKGGIDLQVLGIGSKIKKTHHELIACVDLLDRSDVVNLSYQRVSVDVFLELAEISLAAD